MNLFRKSRNVILERIRIKKIKKWTLSIALVLSVVYLMVAKLGHWIVRQDVPVKSDLIFVLMGSMEDRSAFTINLFRNGYAKKILLINPYNKQRELFPAKWVNIPTGGELMRKILIDHFIDSVSIELIDGNTRNTLDEGRALATYCILNPSIKNVLVVTSSYHSNRAHMILQRELERKKLKVNLNFPLNTYTPYEPDNWWKTEYGIKVTFTEIVKTVWWLLSK